MRAALDRRLAASQLAAGAALNASVEEARAALVNRPAGSDRHQELETIRMQIEAARIAASAHGNVARETRAALRAERLAGATLRRLMADIEQRIAAMERELASRKDGRDPQTETLKRSVAEIQRAWSEAEARLERTNRDWSLEVERIRHSLAAAEAQTLARYGRLLEAAGTRTYFDDGPRVDQSASGQDNPAAPKPGESEAKSETAAGAAGRALPPAAKVDALVMPSPLMREADRQAFHEQVQVQVDGEAALLVDLSVRGAQVVSRNVLKPNRAVKMLLPLPEKPLACKGQVVWARLEPSTAPGSLRYRAGMLFTNPDTTAIQGFLTDNSTPPDAAGGVAAAHHQV